MAEITNKLLKQAIADAEAVRETAVASAKLVLEEAITPQIKDMIARRLRVEADMEHDKEDEAEMKHEAATELPHEEGEAEGSSEMPADSSDIGTGDNKEPSDDAFASADDDMSGEAPSDSETDWYDDWNESDFDLEEIIKELEGDIEKLSGKDHDEEKHDEEEVNEAKHDDEDEDKEVVKEGEDMEMKDDEEEVDLEEILAELEAEEKDKMGHEKMAHDEEEKKVMASELARLKGEMAQYREAVNILRGRLQEVNLLNAKLLFTNKMFRKEGLNNDQKIRIIESFDRATTVREVKLVYTALVENLAVAAKSVNSAPRKKVVAEGFASKATPSTAPKQEVIVENTVAKRLQELAGII